MTSKSPENPMRCVPVSRVTLLLLARHPISPRVRAQKQLDTTKEKLDNEADLKFPRTAKRTHRFAIIWFLRPRSSPLHQPLRVSHQNPHHRADSFHLGGAPPMRRAGRPDPLQPIGRPWAGRQSTMHSASPSGHRRRLARRARPGPGATPR
jgi:hypothetical protein